MDGNKEGICETQTDTLEVGLRDYLECESLLNTFFVEVDFCFSACLSQEVGLYRVRMDMPGDPTEFPGRIGCCPYDEFEHCNHNNVSDRSLLEKRRLAKFGEPEKDKSGCRYHTNEGCILEDHKSPVCLAYVCPGLSHFVYEKYEVIYRKDEIEKGLELILANRQSPEEVRGFKDKIQGFIDRVRICA